jgi:gluconolactonase
MRTVIFGNYEGLLAEPELPPRVYRLDAKTGQATVVADDFDKPHGLAFSSDEKKLYIIDSGLTHGGRSDMRVFDVKRRQARQRKSVRRELRARLH